MDREKKKNLKSLLLRLKAVADMRLLLAVFVAVLGVMGIFAYSFRQIQAGFVEEDGYLVTSRDIYDRLKGEPAEDEKNILLAGVSRDTELFERGGKSYVGEAMEEYEAFPPLSEMERGFVSLEVLSFSRDRVVVQMNYRFLAPTSSFYLAVYDNEVVVYLEDKETIYIETEILLEQLPEELQQEIIDMMWMPDEEALYDFLETYSS